MLDQQKERITAMSDGAQNLSRRDMMRLGATGVAAASISNLPVMSDEKAAQDDGAAFEAPPLPDPCSVYPEVPNITCKDFQLPPDRLTDKQRPVAPKQLQDY